MVIKIALILTWYFLLYDPASKMYSLKEVGYYYRQVDCENDRKSLYDFLTKKYGTGLIAGGSSGWWLSPVCSYKQNS